MRTKDGEKQRALFEATIRVVNELGFASSSVSKIAKSAGISPSTLYIYHKNKEDLLVSTYVEVKREMGAAMAGCFDESLPVRDILRKVWFVLLQCACARPDHYRYAEQFSNSPYLELVDQEELERHFRPLLEVVQRGIERKIIKDVGRPLLKAFLFHPIPFLANAWLREGRPMTEAEMETSFTMAWDAIRL